MMYNLMYLKKVNFLSSGGLFSSQGLKGAEEFSFYKLTMAI